jgi:hypothetical protein
MIGQYLSNKTKTCYITLFSLLRATKHGLNLMNRKEWKRPVFVGFHIFHPNLLGADSRLVRLAGGW